MVRASSVGGEDTDGDSHIALRYKLDLRTRNAAQLKQFRERDARFTAAKDYLFRKYCEFLRHSVMEPIKQNVEYMKTTPADNSG